ncbi:hypothetical protein PM082_015255 [Marasmius tenuissimus]|nr:hypothetical protein PM082_015269 [Marasmius tenuissimus]KAJ8096034.1 hypothetical protein PM082_015255 [Marasmius tenuissimus]
MPGPRDLFVPMFFGMLLDVALLGTLSIQVISYFHNYSRDRWWFKCLVVYLMVAELANTVCDILTVYEPLVTHYGTIFADSPRLLPADAITTTFVSTAVQLFMAWRIGILMGSVIPRLIITAMSIVSTVGAVWLASGVINVVETNFRQPTTTIRDASCLWLISSSITDVTITLCIIFVYVKRALSHRASGSNIMDTQVSRVLKLSIESGTITALATISDLVVFLSVHLLHLGLRHFEALHELVVSFTQCPTDAHLPRAGAQSNVVH